MGMRIGGMGPQSGAQGVGAANWQQRQQSVKDLMAALQAGDLGAAQKAFGTLPGASNIASSDSTSPLAQIGKALQAGDLAAAQQAAQSWQAARASHHHHHGAQAAPAAPAGAAGTGAIVNLIA
jgi:soluble cytochrome b562